MRSFLLLARSWALIGVAIIGAGYLHLRWLPSHGINGWTGEPKEKYYELIDATRAPEAPRFRAGRDGEGEARELNYRYIRQ
jgi:hypothetical protein